MGISILQINKFYHPLIGGVETVVKQYAEGLIEDNDVTVLCVKKRFSIATSREIINGVKVIRCSSFGTFFSMPVSVSFFVHFLLAYKKFDILHFHEPFPLASLCSMFLSSKRTIFITWHSDIIKQKFLKKVVEIFQKKLCKKATCISTTSPNLLNSSTVLPAYKDKSFFLPLSINIANFTVTNTVDESYILYLGRLSYYKGINVLLDAYRKSNSKLKLLIVGSGEKDIEESISNFVLESGLNIEFINRFVSEEEKNQYLKKCSFFVLPSTEASEAFAIIQLEAMIHSKPVINTDLPTGVPYVSLHEKTGLTVEPKNSTELSRAISILENDIDLRIRLGNNAKERVVNMFSDKSILEKLRTKYLEISKT